LIGRGRPAVTEIDHYRFKPTWFSQAFETALEFDQKETIWFLRTHLPQVDNDGPGIASGRHE
jgi:hypothetical protein